MNRTEFDNEFDVLYNNITSNQAPGLDAYEKSVFLTRAQDEIVKAYFSPVSNKVQEGFDTSPRRQIDFSNLITTVKVPLFPLMSVQLLKTTSIREDIARFANPKVLLDNLTGHDEEDALNSTELEHVIENFLPWIFCKEEKVKSLLYKRYTVGAVTDSVFDNRDTSKAFNIASNILMFINEYVVVKRRGKPKRLVVRPIIFVDYNTLTKKPFAYPSTNEAWRLIDSSEERRAEIVVGPNDTIEEYVYRYVRRPKPILLDDFDDVSLGGGVQECDEDNPCELDPILHPEIVQRAVELAKAVYTGDLSTSVGLGTQSQTPVGILSNPRDDR